MSESDSRSVFGNDSRRWGQRVYREWVRLGLLQPEEASPNLRLLMKAATNILSAVTSEDVLLPDLLADSIVALCLLAKLKDLDLEEIVEQHVIRLATTKKPAPPTVASQQAPTAIDVQRGFLKL